jgi:hypothetical protein
VPVASILEQVRVAQGIVAEGSLELPPPQL